jgi:RNAse (barnase) inhibitor barstar
MRNIVLDATTWKTSDDFYDALFRGLGAPTWHGRNFNALKDSIITGHINKIELPYTISISGIGKTPPEVRNLVRDFCSLVEKFKASGYVVDAICEE